MIVDRERFLRELVVDLKRPDRRVGIKSRHQFKPKVALEHARLGDAVTPEDILIRRAAKKVAVIKGGQ